MRKILNCFLGAIIIFCLFHVAPQTYNSTLAFESNENNISQIQTIAELFMFENGEEKRLDRFAGSEGERESANFIKQLMSTFAPSFLPVNDGVGKIDGVQSFTCKDSNGNLIISQNLIFYKAGAEDNKVVISVAYDNFFGFAYTEDMIVDSTGFNLSVLNIATLVHIANSLHAVEKLPFSIEIVFFGAENSFGEGSAFYKRGMGEIEAYKTLFFATIGDLSGNNRVNISSGERRGEFSSFLSNALNKATDSEAFKKFSGGLSIGRASQVSSQIYHAGLNFASSKFFESNIPAASIFSGDYNGIVFYNYADFIYDTYQVNIEKFGKKTFSNAEIISTALVNFLSQENFESSMRHYWGKQSGSFWNDSKVSAAVSISLFVILLILQFFISDMLKNNFEKALAKKGKTIFDLGNITEKVISEMNEGKISGDRMHERIEELIAEKIEDENSEAEDLSTRKSSSKKSSKKEDFDKSKKEDFGKSKKEKND